MFAYQFDINNCKASCLLNLQQNQQKTTKSFLLLKYRICKSCCVAAIFSYSFKTKVGKEDSFLASLT